MNPIALTNPDLNASVRIIERDDQPWFVAKDVCDCLSIQNVAQAVDRLDDDEVCQTYVTDTIGREQKTYIVSESGLYALILRSDKPAAKAFRKWVTSEVLPSLRKDGFYASRLSPGDRELLALEYGLKAAKLRDDARYWDHKAAQVHHLEDAVPLMEWIRQAHPDLSTKQAANLSRTLKTELLAARLPVGRNRHRHLTARREDLKALPRHNTLL
jgi:prophage antirepressor-like protein